MNLNELIYLCSVVRTGTYSAAAEEADVSEPVVHRAVSTLERRCGLRLLERVGKRIHPTPDGEALLEYGSRIESLAQLAEQVVAQRRMGTLRRVTIGVGGVVVGHFLPAILSPWIAANPSVEVVITEGKAERLEKELLEERLDIVISAGAKWAAKLTSQLVFYDKLVVVCPIDHPFAGRELVTIAELSGEKMILFAKGSALRREMDELEYQYGVRFKPAVEVDRLDPIEPLCLAGIGLSVLPSSAISQGVLNSRLVLPNVEAFPRRRPYFVVYRSDRALSAEMKSLLHQIQKWTVEREHCSEECQTNRFPSATIRRG